MVIDILSHTVFQLLRSIDQIGAFDRRDERLCYCLTHSFPVISMNVAMNHYCQQ